MKKLFFLSLPFLLFATDDSTATTPKIEQHPRVGVACIVQMDGKVLLGRRKGSHGAGLWACPGGHLEFGETAEACAARELLEETGLTPLSVRLGPWVENMMENGKKHYVTLFVFIDEFTGTLELKEPHKCDGWEWASWDDLPTPLFDVIPSLLAKKE